MSQTDAFRLLGTIFVEFDMFSSAHFGSLHSGVLLAIFMMLDSSKCLSGSECGNCLEVCCFSVCHLVSIGMLDEMDVACKLVYLCTSHFGNVIKGMIC